MDVNLIFKIAAIGILVAVLNLILVRSGRDEQALLTTLAGLIVVLMMLLQQISDLGIGQRLFRVFFVEQLLDERLYRRAGGAASGFGAQA